MYIVLRIVWNYTTVITGISAVWSLDCVYLPNSDGEEPDCPWGIM